MTHLTVTMSSSTDSTYGSKVWQVLTDFSQVRFSYYHLSNIASHKSLYVFSSRKIHHVLCHVTGPRLPPCVRGPAGVLGDLAAHQEGLNEEQED